MQHIIYRIVTKPAEVAHEAPQQATINIYVPGSEQLSPLATPFIFSTVVDV